MKTKHTHTYNIENLNGEFYASRNPDGVQMLNNCFAAYAGGVRVCYGRTLKQAISKAQKRLSKMTQVEFDAALKQESALLINGLKWEETEATGVRYCAEKDRYAFILDGEIVDSGLLHDCVAIAAEYYTGK